MSKYLILIFVLALSINVLPQNIVGPKVTFVELGSVNCIPCKQMQPVMKAIEEKYKTATAINPIIEKYFI